MIKSKKGFVFVETLIVVAVLTASLLMVYSTYSNTIYKEKVRMKYNDSVYLYRTYYLGKFYRNFNLKNFILSKSDNDVVLVNENNLFASLNCDVRVFENKENQELCANLFNVLHINRVLIAKNDIHLLQDCINYDGVCHVFRENGISNEFFDYIKTIGGKDLEGYRIIVEYKEKKDGTTCELNDKCEYYFATLSLGDL